MKIESNTEFINNIMNFSNYGPLSQTFVIEALFYYCKAVTSEGLPKDDGNSFISPVLWFNLAKDIEEKLIEKYETTGDISR